MQTLILWLHVLTCICLIVMVLLQHGKGADAGATFGSSSNSMFGSRGAMPFMMKITAVMATIFFITSLTLSILASHPKLQDARLPMAMTVMPASQPVSTGGSSGA